ncbi:MAG: hypothetical protein ACRC6F_06570 [Aeromonas sp.]
MQQFDWDGFFSKSSWDDIRSESPLLNTKRLPSLVLHENGIVYVSSLDLDARIDDIQALRCYMNAVKSIFNSENKLNGRARSNFKIAVAESDFYMLEQILDRQGEANLPCLDDDDI